VVAVEHLGSDTFVHVAIADDSIVCARAAADIAIAQGATVGLSPTLLHRFDAEGKTLHDERQPITEPAS
jgi:multiple sugar transport system ATP-binding protein